MIHAYSRKEKNVLLRPLEEKDIEQLRVWRNNPSNTKYLRKIPIITKEKQRSWFVSYLNNPDELIFAIEECEDLNRLVGSLSLYSFNGSSCCFGRILVGDNEAHNKNVGLNATIAVIKVAFYQLGLEKIELTVFPENLPALTIYNKAGFNIENEHITEEGRIEYLMVIKKEDISTDNNE